MAKNRVVAGSPLWSSVTIPLAVRFGVSVVWTACAKVVISFSFVQIELGLFYDNNFLFAELNLLFSLSGITLVGLNHP
jgi:hypothetical protein